jgi:hypothetical protein
MRGHNPTRCPQAVHAIYRGLRSRPERAGSSPGGYRRRQPRRASRSKIVRGRSALSLVRTREIIDRALVGGKADAPNGQLSPNRYSLRSCLIIAQPTISNNL